MKKYFLHFVKIGWLLPLFMWGDLVNTYLKIEVQPKLNGLNPGNSFPYLESLETLFKISWMWAIVALGFIIYEKLKITDK